MQLHLEKFPQYFAAWIQKGSDQCIYTPLQLKRFNSPHLEAGCWYLDCIRGFVIESEAELKSELDGGSSPSTILETVLMRPKASRINHLHLHRRKGGGGDCESWVLSPRALRRLVQSPPHRRRALPFHLLLLSFPIRPTTPAPSSVSASAITRGLLEQRKARLLPASTSSAGTPHSTGVSIIKSSVTPLLVRNMELKDKGGHPDWVKTLEFVRKV